MSVPAPTHGAQGRRTVTGTRSHRVQVTYRTARVARLVALLRRRNVLVSRFCVRLRSDLADVARSFPGLDVRGADGIVSVCGDFDDAALHGVLERVRVLGYEIFDVYRSYP